MKNSGGEPEGNVDHVLHLGRWQTKVVGDVREAIAGLDAIYEVLPARPTVNDERLSELGSDPRAPLRIDRPEGVLAAPIRDAGRIRCIGTPALRSALSTNASAKPTKGTVADRRARGNTVTNGSAPRGRAH